jgi:hypothetical protein
MRTQTGLDEPPVLPQTDPRGFGFSILEGAEKIGFSNVFWSNPGNLFLALLPIEWVISRG